MRTLARLLRSSLLLVLFTVLFAAYATFGQTETGTISGLITDETGAAVPRAEVQLLSVQRGTTSDAKTNEAGIYVFTGVQPGIYQLKVQKSGFKQVDLLSLIVNVQDHMEQNVRLQVGSVSESVTVDANALHMNTTDASVSTVVDRQFAENLPMNGRTFQTLIQLTPGVVVVPSDGFDQGQFSVNGQRASSNYWMVDGVSANIGTSAFNPSNGAGGAVGAYSALGGTNSLVSVDALQEFRIQTSTFAPEFGRTPGAQISILTRSGQNIFHGSIFDYLRNDALDANDWFANKKGLPKPQERQNDFGGTFSGPILKNRTFFFFSYEGFRLRLPQTALFFVPSQAARQSAPAAVQPYLNLYPIPNGANQGDGTAEFNASYSNRSSLDAYSLRLDHKFNDKLNVFGRYNYSPSNLVQRGANGDALSELTLTHLLTQTATVGATWMISPTIVNDFRFNYSQASATSRFLLDNFGGAIPLSSLPIPSPLTASDAKFAFGIFSFFGNGALLQDGANANNVQHQINIVDSISLQKHSHSLKFGVDYRRLTPLFGQLQYEQDIFFDDINGAISNNLSQASIFSGLNATLLFRNLSLFAQDTWRVLPRLTLTCGLRWDTDFAPATLSGPPLPAVTGFNLNDLSNLALAPVGTPVFKTRYGNLAPRVGVAYHLNAKNNWGTVVRGGFGMFYDLVTGDAGNLFFPNSYPLGAGINIFGGSLPLTPVQIAPPPIIPPDLKQGQLDAYDPHLPTPYTLQWNIAAEQALGSHQTVSLTYIGAAGRHLTQTSTGFGAISHTVDAATLISGVGRSSYNALQLKFDRQLSHGLQALASYTWSHSIDTGSAGSFDKFSNLSNSASVSANQASSDFDIRHALSAGFTYAVSTKVPNRFMRSITNGWSFQSIVQLRSAPPADVHDTRFFRFANLLFADVRPDIVTGQPFYLFGPQYPGGKRFNSAAFADPPSDPTTHLPLRQGTASRNFLRGFGATQWDFAIHRAFAIHEGVHLEFRAEMFNVLNHPNFAQPNTSFGSSRFGLSNQMLGRSLSGPGGSGGLSPLFQIGGPRSIQVALKLIF